MPRLLRAVVGGRWRARSQKKPARPSANSSHGKRREKPRSKQRSQKQVRKSTACTEVNLWMRMRGWQVSFQALGDDIGHL